MQENLLRSQAGSARFNVSLTRGALIRQLTMLLGELPRRVVEFEPMVDVS